MKLTYQFDEFGNRRRVMLDSVSHAGVRSVIDNWFKYDATDRAMMVDGLLDRGEVVAGVQACLAKGYTLSYDAAERCLGSEQSSATLGSYQRSEYTCNDLNQVVTRSARMIIRQTGVNTNGPTQSISDAQVNLANTYDAHGRPTCRVRQWHAGKHR
ncbi:hypothetical protein [Pseudomonas sp. SDI]|uniref:hypothetical protein n=1 Tax=Pseudomonas sp. SDI TaxID=2170734 RepID=UPI001057A179|nr:hypothetical protein [Pseudomonas sp. SDI]